MVQVPERVKPWVKEKVKMMVLYFAFCYGSHLRDKDWGMGGRKVN
jgi:hypothetical protein